MSHSKGGPDDALKLLSEFCTLPRRSGFRTTTGVHLHTGFKAWLRCDPSVVRGLWRRTEERTFAKKRALLPTNMQLKLQVFAAIFCFPFTRVCDNFIKPAIYPSREKGGRTKDPEENRSFLVLKDFWADAAELWSESGGGGSDEENISWTALKPAICRRTPTAPSRASSEFDGAAASEGGHPAGSVTDGAGEGMSADEHVDRRHRQ
ncbi:hypothetical protein FQA47_016045 [Oryzias melastigma]|uniref:Uncharacterized protein n=1 Tax=Oryzias melastigma TaxID=30732 RepID=A0A834FN62_ORYME|nr:hypothetical protein FQA47_016045 [Oryzias melastigma]